MQETMMNNFMMNMWKSIDDIPTVKWIKDISLSKDIEPKQISVQTLAFNKSIVDYIYKATLLSQEQVEKIAEPILKNTPGIPEGWGDMFKKNQEQIKKVVDESFIKAESFFSPTSSKVKEAKPIAEQTKTKAEPKSK